MFFTATVKTVNEGTTFLRAEIWLAQPSFLFGIGRYAIDVLQKAYPQAKISVANEHLTNEVSSIAARNSMQ
jgi:hypothetical protein